MTVAAIPASAKPTVCPRPFVHVRKGETFVTAVERYRRETGHTGWCIINMRRFHRRGA